ncbi:MAG: chorismate synthase [Fibrobacterales bacterium]
MSSVLGNIFKISTWGESHGKALGVVVDGCPAGMPIDEDIIQKELDKRRPGQNKLVTQRKESDTVQFLSGIFEGKTTGTPISMVIFNEDQRSKDYGNIAETYRPSHADLTYDLKYGFRDYRGGGRSSARETAGRVAAGALAKQLLLKAHDTQILAYVKQIGSVVADIDPLAVTEAMIEAHPTRCPDPEAAVLMEQEIRDAQKDHDSVGGVIELVITNAPIGLGEPVFDRVEANLAKAMLSIMASKGFEIGEGFNAGSMRGSAHNDAIIHDENGFHTKTNHAGGTLGGITNGEPIICRIAFKPTATISQPLETVTRSGEATSLTARGRHDPCVATRAPVIVEAMAALTLADLFLENRAKIGLF